MKKQKSPDDLMTDVDKLSSILGTTILSVLHI